MMGRLLVWRNEICSRLFLLSASALPSTPITIVFDIGQKHNYEDAIANEGIMKKVASKCYLPMNALLLELIEKHQGAFKISFSIPGTALDQFATLRA